MARDSTLAPPAAGHESLATRSSIPTIDPTMTNPDPNHDTETTPNLGDDGEGDAVRDSDYTRRNLKAPFTTAVAARPVGDERAHREVLAAPRSDRHV